MVEQKHKLGADFGQRFLTALVIGPGVVLLVLIGRPVFDIGIAVIGALAGYELQRMFRPHHQPSLIITILTILACITGSWSVILLAAALFLIAGAVEVIVGSEPKLPFFGRYYVLLLVGTLYIGLPLGLLTQLRAGHDGLLLTLMLLLNNFGTDAFALIGGRVAGRHKLAPTISPGKTFEGAAIGLTVGFLIGLAIALVGGVALPLALIANAVIAVSVEVGDLIESWTKRRLAVKDSGHLLPGHGGVLDRIDGTLLAVPCLVLILMIFG